MENSKNNKPAFFQNDFIANPDKYDNSKPPSDFTDDKSFSKEKQLTKKKMLASLVEAVTVFRSTNDAKVKNRARKLYLELLEFITSSDFTDDAFKTDKSKTKWNLVGTLAQAYKIWQDLLKAGNRETIDGQEAIDRAAKVYWELKSYITEDFTDDRGTPVVNELIRVLDRLMFIIDRQQGRLAGELESMSDKEADRLYKHKFIREFKVDIIP